MFVPRAGESLASITGVEDAQRRFLRIVDVTDRISDSRTCLSKAGVDLCVGITSDMREYEPQKCERLKGADATTKQS